MLKENYPQVVCHDCGSKYGKAWTRSTWHTGVCGVCKETKSVTEPRDYGYPDFSKEVPDSGKTKVL